ncbi:MAG: 16S rRNA (guanine(527)-N(7))-methyltransferase RsmG [Pseudomonadota bacterium]
MPHNLNPDLSGKLSIYKALLIKWSKAINLVSPSTLTDIDARHFNDSLQLLKFIPEDTKTLLDIGSGAGFPGLVLALARPDMSVHLVESDQRKCSFLSAVSRETNIPVIINNARVEAVDKSIAPNVITARALADLTTLLKLTEKFWLDNKALTLILPKGAKWSQEVIDAKIKYDFSYEHHTSLTEKDAAVLVLTNIKYLK